MSKYSQNGLAMPILVAIVAGVLLAVGGYIYFYGLPFNRLRIQQVLEYPSSKSESSSNVSVFEQKEDLSDFDDSTLDQIDQQLESFEDEYNSNEIDELM